MRNILAGFVLAVAAVMPVHAGVIAFDNAYASLGNGNKAATYYLASDGMTMSGTYFGLVGGNGNGDPGNWNLNGTNGSAFLGCNSNSSCSPTFNFSSVLSSLSMDLGMPGFGWSGQFTVSALLGNTLVDTAIVNLSSPQDPGNWGTASVSGAFDTVTVSFLSTGGGSFAFGIDNIVYQAGNNVPEPESLLLASLGLIGLAVSRRQRA